jgi:SAM-dependent methyltransferase
VRLNDRDWGARCVRCAASAVHVALGRVLRERIADISALDACEFSARGPLVEYLKKHARSLAASEYFEGVAPGATHGGVRCEDVQHLSYADASFDVVTHTEVFEHIPDDRRAFAECHRVLRPGGMMLFTVPLHGGERTIERARLSDGVIEHLHPPVLHGDPLRGGAGILAFRDYGRDILERLRNAGFARAHLHAAQSKVPWLPMREVVIACKENR